MDAELVIWILFSALVFVTGAALSNYYEHKRTQESLKFLEARLDATKKEVHIIRRLLEKRNNDD